jgi:hypothetical protein
MRMPLIALWLALTHLLSACAEKRPNEFVTCIQSDGSTAGVQHEGYKAGCSG